MRSGATFINPYMLMLCISIFICMSIGGYFVFVREADAFRQLEKLDVIAYSDSAKTFQGGVYLVQGTMEELLQAKTGLGKLVSLSISTSKGVILIPVLIPESLGGFNLQKGQSLKIKVKSIDHGLLVATKIDKS